MGKAIRQLANDLRHLPDAETWPEIGLGVDINSTSHFLARADLMERQGMRREEIAEALSAPIEVKFSAWSSRFYYCGRRVAVVASLNGGGVVTFVTVLWATERLWAKNPRPEVEAA